MGQFLGVMAVTLLGAAAGLSFVMQQAVNADLRAALNSAAWAGFVSYLGGTLCMLVLALLMRDGAPTTAAVARSSWWAWSGGFFGAVYMVAGQMLSSLAFDHWGLFGVTQHGAGPARLLGAALLVAGVVLVRI